MRKGKKLLAAILAAAITMTSTAPAFAAVDEIFTDSAEVFVETVEAPAAKAAKPVLPSVSKMKPKWNTINGKKYYLDENKKLFAGWHVIDKAKYYFDPKTRVCVSGLKTISGKKYYFDPKTNKLIVNRLKYRISGKYYSIDKKGVLKALSTVEQLAADRVTKVRKSLWNAFVWSSKLKYRNVRVPAGKKEANYLGEFGFKNSAGDCYVQAYTFMWMARALGYEARYIKGYVPQMIGGKVVYGSHAWVEVKMNGKFYVFDPNFEGDVHYAQLGAKRGYKFTYGAKNHYKYCDKNKKEIRR